MKTDKTQPDLSQLIIKIQNCSVIETKKMFALYQDYLCRLLSGSSLIWIASYRGDYGRKLWKTEFFNNWKLMEMTFLVDGNPECIAAMEADYYQMSLNHGLDPITEYAIKTAGKTRVYRREDILTNSEWSKHWLKEELWDKHNIGDRIIGIFSVDSQSESFLSIQRPIGSPPFNLDDKKILYQAMQEFSRMHHLLLLERGLTKQSKSPLSPRQQELVKLMFTPLTEKEIASKMGISQVTVHGYITDLYKNFNVKNRLEIIQLWLNPFSTD